MIALKGQKKCCLQTKLVYRLVVPKIIATKYNTIHNIHDDNSNHIHYFTENHIHSNILVH